MSGKRSFHIRLSSKERKTIKHFQKNTSSSNARTRCAILLAADSGKYTPEKSYEEIAEMSGASVTTVIHSFYDCSYRLREL